MGSPSRTLLWQPVSAFLWHVYTFIHKQQCAASRQDHCWDLLPKHHCLFLACSSEPCLFLLHRWSRANELSSSLPACQRKCRTEITRLGPLCPRLRIPSTPRRSPLETLQPAPPEASHHYQAGAVQRRGDHQMFPSELENVAAQPCPVQF